MKDLIYLIPILLLMVPICLVALWTTRETIEFIRIVINWWVHGK